jgi:hypothetical protein
MESEKEKEVILRQEKAIVQVQSFMEQPKWF